MVPDFKILSFIGEKRTVNQAASGGVTPSTTVIFIVLFLMFSVKYIIYLGVAL